MSSDTISNMLSSIKNISMLKKEFVEVPYSKNSEAIAKVLEKSGFIGKVKTFKEKGSSFKSLRIDLAYETDGAAKIREIKRVSKPGRRIYVKSKGIKKRKPEFGVFVVSTSQGIMSGEEARTKGLGGEVVCEVS